MKSINMVKDYQLSLLSNQEEQSRQTNPLTKQPQVSQVRSSSRKRTYLNQRNAIQQEQQDDSDSQLRNNIDIQLIMPILQKLPEDRTVQDLDTLSNKLVYLEFFEKMLSDETIKNKYKLLKEMKIETYSQNGQIIFKEGEGPNKFYVILNGGVKLVKNFYPRTTQLSNNTMSSQTFLSDQQKDANQINRLLEQDTKYQFQQGQYFGQNEMVYYSKRLYSALTFNSQKEDQLGQQQTILIYLNQNIFNNQIQEFLIKQNPFYRSFSLLKLIPKEGKVRISYEHIRKQLNINDIVYKQDQKIEYIYYLDTGNVQLKYSQNEILDVLPHSVQQKKQQTQIVSTIPEKSFFGDEDLNNLNGTRKYTAVVTSINATLYLFDAKIIQEEMLQAYGSTRTNQMIDEYLLSKQKWRDEHIQQAINVKNQFGAFQYSGAKINSNLVLKNQSESKQNLLNVNNIISSNSQNYSRTIYNESRCVTEESQNFKTKLLNTSLSELQVGDFNSMNQNHLKSINLKSTSKKGKLKNDENNFRQYVNNDRSQLNKLNNFLNNQLGSCNLINKNIEQKRPIKNTQSKFHTLDSEVSIFNEQQKSQINIANQDILKLNRSESLTLQDQNGESIIILPLNQSFKNQQGRQQVQESRVSSFSPNQLNKTLFKIRLQRMEENEKSSISEINTNFGHTSLILSEKHNLSYQNLSPGGGQKVYDPFNDCWVRKTSPKKNNLSFLDSSFIKNQHLKYQGSVDSPYSKQFLQSVNDLSDPSYLSNSKQSLGFQQYFNEVIPKTVFNNQYNYEIESKKGQASLKILCASQKKCFLEGKEKRRNLSNNQQSQINQAPILNQEFLNNITQNCKSEPKTKKYQQASQQKIDFTVSQQKIQKVTSNSSQLLQNQNKHFEEQILPQKDFYQQNFKASATRMNQQQVRNDQHILRQEPQQISQSNVQASFNGLINSQSKDYKHQSLDCSNNQNETNEKGNLFKSLRKQSIEKANTIQKISEQNLNKFIEENCNGNEIYQIECSNLLGKKKQILKYLLSQIGSGDLNCIDMNQDQKNTKYDNLLRILMKQKQENKSKQARSTKNYSNSMIIKQNSQDDTQANKSRNLDRDFCSDFQSIERQKFSPIQNEKKKFHANKNKSSLNVFKQYLRFTNDFLNKEISTSLMGNVDDKATIISDQINQFTQSYTPIDYHRLNSSGKENKLKINTTFKQKLEMRRKLKTPSLSHSTNRKDCKQEQINFSNLHQTLFIIPKQQVEQ